MSIYKKITLMEIPDYEFEGYYWYSDQQKPEIVTASKIDKSKFTLMPFVIEANFYARKEKVSIQIKNIDGAYQIGRIELDQDDIDKSIRYIGHDLDGRNFKMVEAWEAIEDGLLEGIKSLQPAWGAFAGFTN